MNLEEILAQKSNIDNRFAELTDRMSNTATDLDRIIGITEDIDRYLDDFDNQFEQISKLSRKDLPFVILAATFQTFRWILMPELKIAKIEDLNSSISVEDRMNSSEKKHIGGIYDGKSSGAFLEKEKTDIYIESNRDYFKKDRENYYKSKYMHKSASEILLQNVPYDAMNALDIDSIPDIAGINGLVNDKYKNMYAGNHHVLTLGHDPVLGWIFGTANILTDTITLCNFSSFDVIRGHKVKGTGEFVTSKELQFSDLSIDYSSIRFLVDIFYECYLSIREDSKRFAAAVIRQGIHIASDKYCKQGLPIPFMPVVNPQKAQELLDEGWNSVEISKLLKADIKTLAVSEMVDIVINALVAAMYMFCVDTGDDIGIKKVKISKILTMSNEIAGVGNVLYVALTRNIAKVDISGIATTVIMLLNNPKFMGDIKREYLSRHMEELIRGKS